MLPSPNFRFAPKNKLALDQKENVDYDALNTFPKKMFFLFEAKDQPEYTGGKTPGTNALTINIIFLRMQVI